MGLADLVLFYGIAGFGLQWIATAASAGPRSLLVWPAALLVFYLPLVAAVIDLSARYPADGGLYVWTREAFGDYIGFISGWCYWFSNLPYFANVLYFGATSALVAAGLEGGALKASPTFYVAFSVVALTIITLLNLFGLRYGKWVTNVGSIGMWVASLILVVLGAASWALHGHESGLSRQGLHGPVHLQEIAFWGAMVLAFSGVESASFMGGEIRNPKQTIPRALVIAGTLTAALYFIGTLTTLASLPADQISNLGGPVDAIAATARRLHCEWLVPLAALGLALGQFGTTGCFLSACSRIPFAIGVDHRLPAAFARVHPKWGTPYVALLAQSALACAVIVLSQAGSSVRSAYTILVSMTVIANFIPFVFMFAALARFNLGRCHARQGQAAWRRHGLVLLGVVGTLTAIAVCASSFIPPVGQKDVGMATLKVIIASVVMLGAGSLIFVLPRGRRPG